MIETFKSVLNIIYRDICVRVCVCVCMLYVYECAHVYVCVRV